LFFPDTGIPDGDNEYSRTPKSVCETGYPKILQEFLDPDQNDADWIVKPPE
jgi:hypothetical protein